MTWKDEYLQLWLEAVAMSAIIEPKKARDFFQKRLNSFRKPEEVAKKFKGVQK